GRTSRRRSPTAEPPQPTAPSKKPRSRADRPSMAAKPARVVLGVTGSIAAYKAAEIVRGLTKAGCEVRCALTPAGAKFITPMTLAALSRGPVAQELHDPALW